jgi:hypothetical protein
MEDYSFSRKKRRCNFVSRCLVFHIRYLSKFDVHIQVSLVMCYPSPFYILKINFSIEPTNNVPPKSSGRKIDGSIVIDVPLNQDIVITCEVSGYPIPKFRY